MASSLAQINSTATTASSRSLLPLPSKQPRMRGSRVSLSSTFRTPSTQLSTFRNSGLNTSGFPNKVGPRGASRVVASTEPTGKYIGKFGHSAASPPSTSTSTSTTSKVASAVLPQHVRQTLNPGTAFWPLLLAIAVPVIGGVFISSVASPMSSWYANLEKPSWDPPDWTFGAVWSVLYVLMGVASFLVWADGHWAKQGAPLQLYAWHLLVNFAWPIVFFRLKNIRLGAIVLGVLVLMVNATMRSFWEVNRVAGWLMLPYQAWVLFAFVLNLTFWRLNRGSSGSSLKGASWAASPRGGDW